MYLKRDKCPTYKLVNDIIFFFYINIGILLFKINFEIC